jgi:hypothetical protein
MKPGPKPSNKCPNDNHIRYPEDVRAILDNMGKIGTPQDKLIYLAREYGKTIPPTSKLAHMARIQNARVDQMSATQYLNTVISQAKEFGLSSNEIDGCLDELKIDAE